jgi:hypothetical protein
MAAIEEARIEFKKQLNSGQAKRVYPLKAD